MQRRAVSLLEQVINLSIGFLTSLVIWTYFVVPFWQLDVNMVENIEITGLFTLISIVRGYMLRRLFNFFTFRKLR